MTLAFGTLLFLGMAVAFFLMTRDSYVQTKWIPIGLFSALAMVSLIRYMLYTAEIKE